MAAIIRPTLLTIKDPNTPTAIATGTLGRCVIASSSTARDGSDDSVDFQLAILVRQLSHDGRSNQRQNSTDDVNCGKLLFSHADVRDKIGTHVGKDGKTADHQGMIVARERFDMIGVRKDLDNRSQWMRMNLIDMCIQRGGMAKGVKMRSAESPR